MNSSGTDMHGDGLRSQNARAAAVYDVLPYEALPGPWLDVERVLGVGAIYGCNAAPLDVLDLGCGTGLALARAAGQAAGRLIGVDLSDGNCRKARERLSALGPRAEILEADFLDLDADRLGRFDLVYAIGVVYIVPPQVRQHLIRLIGHCLKPGGVVIVSHYSGPLAALRGQLHAIVRATINEPDPVTELRAARVRCRELAQRLEHNPSSLPLACLHQTMSLPDMTFYHEIFNPWLAPIPAAEMNRDFSEHGIGFLCRTDLGSHGVAATPAARAFEADVEDLAGGGYRISMFGRDAGAPANRSNGSI
jgi:SAM-dependent methyltransferase